MKSLFFPLVALMIIAFTAQIARAQAPITIAYNNFLMPSSSDVNYHYTEGNIAAPAEGENKIYDYGHQKDVNAFDFTNTYTSPVNQNFTTARTTLLSGGLFSDISLFFSTDHSGVKLLGQECPAFRNSLESITGDPSDSLIEDDQSLSAGDSFVVNQFPETYGTHWNYSGSLTVNALVSLASEGLDHAPISFTVYESGYYSIVGWGKMRVRTASGPSKYIRGLLFKNYDASEITLYVNGEPASEGVSEIFLGDSTNQITLTSFIYGFSRMGVWSDLADFYMIDSSFSTVAAAAFSQSFLDINCNGGVEICINGETQCVPYKNNAANHALMHGATLGTCDGMKTVSEESAASDESAINIYPNPSTGIFNLQFQSADESATNASIEIRNELGQLMFQKNYSLNSGLLQQQIDLGSLRAGVYNVIVHAGAQVMMRTIVIQ